MNEVIYVTLLLAIGVTSVQRGREKIFDAFSFFSLHFGLAYGLVPLIVTLFPSYPIGLPGISGPVKIPSICAQLSLVSYVVFLLGWTVAGSIAGPRPSMKGRISEQTILKLVYGGLLVSALAFYVYVQAFGGLRAAMEFGGSYRLSSGFRADFEIGPAAAFAHFIPLAAICLYYSVFRLRLSWFGSLGRQYLIICIISCLILVPYALIFSGRGFVIAILLGLLAVFEVGNRRLQLKWLVRLGVLGLVFLSLMLYGKQFFRSMPWLLQGNVDRFVEEFDEVSRKRKLDSDVFKSTVMRESLHCTASLQLAVNYAGKSVPYTLFSDYIYLLPALVPERLFGLSFNMPPTVSRTNTRLMTGIDVASAPPGLVASFLYAYGVAGLAFGMLIYGIIGRFLQNTLESWQVGFPGIVAVAFPLSYLYGGYAVNGDPKVYLFDGLPVALTIIALVFINTKCERNHR